MDRKKIRYGFYARKSSDDKSRQVISIPGQLKAGFEKFADLNIVEVYSDTETAFKPGMRKDFDRLVADLQSGKINGVAGWHPDRICRNSLESGMILELLRTGQIQDMQFNTFTFMNTPEGIVFLQLAFAQSQFFSSKLSTDIQRTLDEKRQQGWRPHRSPVGYLPDTQSLKGLKTILIDEERFPLIQRAFRMMLTGQYSVGYIKDQLNSWGFMTRETRNTPSKPMSLSNMYKVFENKFYAGVFTLPDGTEVPGKHKPMITLKEYNKVRQIMLKRHERRGIHKQRLEFTYKPVLTCGTCRGSITAEHKTKKTKSGNVHKYVYYRCTHKADPTCKERSIEEGVVESTLMSFMSEVAFHPVFKAWTKMVLKTMHQPDKKKKIVDPRVATIRTMKIRLNNLENAFLDQQVEYEDYALKKKEFKSQISKLSIAMKQDEQKKGQQAKQFTKLVELLTDGTEILKSRNLDKKRDLLHRISSNLLVKDKKLRVQAEKWLIPFEKFREIWDLNNYRFEPLESGLPMSKNHPDYGVFLAWSYFVEEYRNNLSLNMS